MKVSLTTPFSSIVLTLVLFTGQVKADWEQVAANVERIVELERRIDDILILVGMASATGLIEKEAVEDIKFHGDIYFVYYLAAQVALANEEMEDFIEYIELASDSLDKMEEIIETPPKLPPVAPAPMPTEMRSL